MQNRRRGIPIAAPSSLWSDRTVGLSGDLRHRRSRQTATPCNVSARMLARSGRTLLDSGKHLARPTTCLQIGEQREKMNEVGAEPLIVMAEPDLNPCEGFALAPRGSDLEVEQGCVYQKPHPY